MVGNVIWHSRCRDEDSREIETGWAKSPDPSKRPVTIVNRKRKNVKTPKSLDGLRPHGRAIPSP